MNSRLVFSLSRARIAPRLATFRTMASSSVTVPPGKYEFLVVVHDKPNVREKRLEVRGVPKDDSVDSLDFAGSTLVCIAESVEEVREQLSKDIYATSGVWDMDKVQIYPFKAAFRMN
ncbi:hypothetical protein BFJ72_g1575 [Fusarium proliferatum]|uniref:YCII-related domain-containing protein n=1 Tax=Gibberella intermedia TaxID=948311 RepID=A0A420U4H0_GIBIN|nr:hypothetical protein BFJ72_g1575 [Fusarium proliferatum]